MSINIGGNNNETTPIPAVPAVHTPVAQAQPQPRTTTQPQQGNLKMNNLMMTRQNYGMSRAATSQAMRTVLETIDKLTEAETAAASPTKTTYITLDGEKEGMKISAIVVVATPRSPTNETRVAAYHTLLLATTSKAEARKEMTVGKDGLRYERIIIPGEAYDRKLQGRVAQVVGAQFPNFKLIDAEASVVPAQTDLKNEMTVRNIVANATSAAGTLLAGEITNDGWAITPEVLKAFVFKNEVKSSWGHFADLAGNPVRADVVMEMSSVERTANNNNDNNSEFLFNNEQSRSLISQITGYIDITRAATSQAQTINLMGMPSSSIDPNMFKINASRFVITNIDTPAVAGELPPVLQALATLQVLQNNGMWKNILLKQYKDGAANPMGGANIRDLSAIGLEAPVIIPPMGFVDGIAPKPQRLPLNSNAINDTAVLGHINTYFIDQMIVSMDVEESGPSSWSLGVFVAAARGDANARRDIFEAMDMLTAGKFSPIYQALNGGTMPAPVWDDHMFVDLGYYETGHGQRDRRDVDHVMVLDATGDAELETINDWANLQANYEVDAMFRLSETRAIQQRLINSAVVTGRAVRITFNPKFIHAAAQAVSEAGLTYDTDMSIAQPQSTARMVSPYMQNLSNLGNAGGFVQGGMNRNQPSGVANNSFGRYANMQQQQTTGNTGSNF